MSQVTKTKNKIVVLCDCGASHVISKDENDELEINSTYKKPDVNDDGKKPKEKRKSGIGSFFDIDESDKDGE